MHKPEPWPIIISQAEKIRGYMAQHVEVISSTVEAVQRALEHPFTTVVTIIGTLGLIMGATAGWEGGVRKWQDVDAWLNTHPASPLVVAPPSLHDTPRIIPTNTFINPTPSETLDAATATPTAASTAPATQEPFVYPDAISPRESPPPIFATAKSYKEAEKNLLPYCVRYDHPPKAFKDRMSFLQSKDKNFFATAVGQQELANQTSDNHWYGSSLGWVDPCVEEQFGPLTAHPNTVDVATGINKVYFEIKQSPSEWFEVTITLPVITPTP